MWTWIIGAAVLTALCGAGYKLYKDRKNGKGCGKCNACRGCPKTLPK